MTLPGRVMQDVLVRAEHVFDDTNHHRQNQPCFSTWRRNPSLARIICRRALTVAVAADRQGGEDRHGGEAPCNGPEQVTGDGASLGESPDGGGGSGEGADFGEGLA